MHPLGLGLLLLVLAVSWVGYTEVLRATGSQQVDPTGSGLVMLETNRPDFGDVAAFDGPRKSRIYFKIANPGEVVHIGLSPEYDPRGEVYDSLDASAYFFRIRKEDYDSDVQNDPVVHPLFFSSSGTGYTEDLGQKFRIDQNTANVTDWTQAAFPIYDVSYQDPESNDQTPFLFEPQDTGLYFIEFTDLDSPDDPQVRVDIGYWDIAVVDNGVEVPGRLFSRLWGFRTPGLNGGGPAPECNWNQQFKGVIYSYTSDQFISEIDFTNSQFQGLSFNVAFNRLGPNTDDDFTDEMRRMSVEGENLTPEMAEHLIFLELPDTSANCFPTSQAGCGEVTGTDISCADGGGYVINVDVTLPGQIDVFINFGGDELVFSDDSPDVNLVTSFTGDDLSVTIEWDGRRADGSLPDFGEEVEFIINYRQGVQHWGIYDVEFMRQNFCIRTISPVCDGSIPTSFLYYDDRNISGQSSLTNPNDKDGREGCDCEGPGCRTWDFFDFASASATCETVGDNTQGYGDKNTLNTWWFASSLQEKVIVPLFTGQVVGDSIVCLATGTANLEAQVAGATDPVTFQWTGPNGFTAGTAAIGPLTEPGLYTVTISDGDGCSTTINRNVQIFDVITFELDTMNVTCPTAPNGRIEVVNVAGGSGNYEYCLNGDCQSSPVFNGLPIGNYQVEVVDLEAVGCDGMTEVELIGPSAPPVNVYPDTLYICRGDSIMIPATDPIIGYDYQWTPMEDIDDPNAIEPKVYPLATTLYEVDYVDPNSPDDCGFSESVLVIVSEEIGLTVDGGGVTCSADTTLVANALAPVTFVWSVDGNPVRTSPAGVLSDSLDVNITDYDKPVTVVAAFDLNGVLSCTDTVTTEVTGGPIELDLPQPVAICLGEMIDVSVSSPSNDSLTYSWTSTIPGIISAGADTNSPDIDPQIGEGFLILTTSNDQTGCSRVDSIPLLVVDSTLSIAFVPEVQCSGAKVTFSNTTSDTTGLDFVWDFGDSNGSNEFSPTYTYTTPGTYQVILSTGQNLSCATPDTVEVTIGDNNLQAGFTYEINCFGATAEINFTDTSLNNFPGDLTYAWTFTGGTPATSTEANPTLTVTENGTITAQLIATSENDCSDTVTQNINLELVIIDLQENYTICEGDMVGLNSDPNTDYDYVWSGTDGFSSTEVNPVVSPDQTTVYQVEILGVGEDTCSITEEVTVEVISFPEDTTEIFRLCPGQSDTLSSGPDDPAYTYAWSPATGLTDTTVANPIFVGTTSQTYTVTVTETASGLDCEEIRTVIVIAQSDIGLEAPDLGVCEGDNITLSATTQQSATIVWYADAALTDSIGAGPDLSVGPFSVGQDTCFYVRAFDEEGCEETEEVCVTVSDCCPDFPINAVVVDANCGFADGRATVTLGGVPAGTTLQYEWSNGATTRSVLGLAGGIYEVTVTVVDTPDDLYENCKAERKVIVNEIGGPQVEVDTLLPTNCLGDNGSITLDIDKGTPPYTVTGTDGVNTFTQTVDAPGLVQFPDLAEGDYEFKITDAEDCSGYAIATVDRDDSAIIKIAVTATDVSECGAEDGLVKVDITGGVSPYQVTLNSLTTTIDGTTTVEFPNRPAGTYKVKVTDADNCMSKDTTVYINDLPFPEVRWTAEDALCPDEQGRLIYDGSGAADEVFTVTLEGANLVVGTVAGDQADTLHLPQENYLVTRTSTADTCVARRAFVISGPDELSFNVQYTAETCDDDTGLPNMDGTISVIQITGGTPAYRVLIDGVESPNPRTDLPAGAYNIAVEDSQGCTAGETAVVTIDSCSTPCPPIELNISQTVIDAECKQSNGEARVYVGELPAGSILTYLWSTGDTDSIVSGLAEGIYEVTVTAEIPGLPPECSPVTQVEIVNVNEIGGPVIAGPTVTNANCVDSTGSIMFEILEGVGPFTVTWNHPTSPQTVGMPGNLVFGDLPPGRYDFEVADSNDCVANVSATIGRDDSGEIDFEATATDVTDCGLADGAIAVSITNGVAPFTILVEGVDLITTNSTSPPPFTGLPAGIYAVSVTDDRGCVSERKLVVINEGIPPQGEWTAANPDCPGELGTLTYDGGGAANESCIVRYAGTNIVIGVFPGDQPANLTVLAGQYEIECTNGIDTCGAYREIFTIINPDPLAFNVQYGDETCGEDGFISVIEIMGGTPGYEVRVIDADGATFTGPLVTGLEDGSYSVIVADSRLCSLDVDITLDSTLFQPCPPETVFVCPGVDSPINMGADTTLDYTWMPGDLVSDSTIVNPTVNITDTLLLTVTIANDTCNRTCEVMVIPYPEMGLAVTPQDTVLCEPDSVTFTAEFVNPAIVDSIEWTDLSGTVLGSGPSYGNFFAASTTLVATATSTDDCVERDTVSVTIFELPCPPDTLFVCPFTDEVIDEVVNNPTFTYEWSPADLVSDPTIANPTVNIGSGDELNLTLTITRGNCTQTCGVVVLPYPEVGLTAFPDTSICVGESVTLQAASSLPATYVWSNGQTGPAITVAPTVTTDYIVTATDTLNNCMEMDTVTVTVDSIDATITPPIVACDTVNTVTVSVSSSNPNLICDWTVTPGGLVTQTGCSAEILPILGTAINVEVLVTDTLTGCTRILTTTVAVDPIDATITPPVQVCDEGDLTIIEVTPDNPDWTYDWSVMPAGALVSINDNSVLVQPIEGDTVQVTVIVTDTVTQCDAMYMTTVTVQEFGSLPGPIFLCESDTIGTINIPVTPTSPDWTYEWTVTPDAALIADNGSDIDVEPVVGEVVNISVIVTDTVTLCSDTLTTTITVGEPIELEAPGDTIICEFPPFTLEASANPDLPGVLFEWYANEVDPDSLVGTEPVYTETDTVLGITNYIVVATDPATGCEERDTVVVNLDPVIAEITADITICEPTDSFTVVVTPNNPDWTYQWSTVPDGALTSTDGGQAIIDPSVADVVTVTAEVENESGCTETLTTTIKYAPIEAMITPDTTLCEPVDSFALAVTPGNPDWTYDWSSNPDGGILVDNGPEVIVDPGVASEYTVVITNEEGCEDTLTTTVTIADPIDLEISPSDTTILCAPDEVTFTATVGTTSDDVLIEWYENEVDDANLIDSGTSITVTPPNGFTNYIAVATDTITGCEEQDTATVVLKPIDAGITDPIVSCEPLLEATLTVTNNDPMQELTYDWFPDGAIIDGDGTAEVLVDPGVAQNYGVIVTNQFGCVDTLETSVTIVDLEVSLDPDTLTIFAGETPTLEVLGCDGCTYEWTSDTGDNSYQPDAFSNPVTVSPSETTTYSVTVSQLGCDTVLSITVLVIPSCPESVYIPNAFTPNDDGLNDVFRVRSEVITDLFIMIYDRWGEKVFETDRIDGAWDGTFNGERLPPDVYGYYVRWTCPGGETEEASGNVTILR